MRLALKIDVNSLRGTRDGTPRLLDLLKRHQAGATFFCTMGPDRSGRAWKMLRRSTPAALKKAVPLSRQYGRLAPLYGRLLPAPHIGKNCTESLKAIVDAGHEMGVQPYDRAGWLLQGRHDVDWVSRDLDQACTEFERVCGEAPRAFAAPGFHPSIHSLRLLQMRGFAYASGSRGTAPYIPLVRAEIIACPQIPVTLPTLHEAVAAGQATPETYADFVIQRMRSEPVDHVLNLNAEIDGIHCIASLERLVLGALEQGYRLVALRDLLAGRGTSSLPRHELIEQHSPEYPLPIFMQGSPFLA